MLPNVAFTQLEANLGTKFTVALIDCEGCVKFVPQALLEQVSLVIIEEDGARIEHAAWHARLRGAGLRRIWHTHDTYWEPTPAGDRFFWSRTMMHAAWSRSSRLSVPSCTQYASRMGYSTRFLNCSTP